MLGGVCAVFFAIGKCAHAFESGFGNEAFEFVECFFVFARESNHERGAEMYVWYFAADGVDEREGFFFCDVAAHVGEHAVVDVLQSNVQVFAHIGMFGHHVKQFVWELSWIGIV